MVVEIINKGKHEVPSYSTELSAGMDLRANIDESYELKPLERHILGLEYILGCHMDMNARSDREADLH